MSIYRQHVVLKRRKSNGAFLEAKMLLLYIFLLSCCLSGSMGNATAEFQANFKAVVDLASKEVFLPVPAKKFQAISGALAESSILRPFSTLLYEAQTLTGTCCCLEQKAVNTCNHVPCQLERTIKQLKVYCKDDQMRTHVSLMEKNMDRIISTLKKAHTRPEKEGSCPTTERPLPDALQCYEKFFEKLHEQC